METVAGGQQLGSCDRFGKYDRGASRAAIRVKRFGSNPGGAIQERAGGDSGGVSRGVVRERNWRSGFGRTPRERHGSELVYFGSLGSSTSGVDSGVTAIRVKLFGSNPGGAI
ncbi:unnamed protein product [Calypogeia fissa]